MKMQVQCKDCAELPVVRVILSKRNLLALLTKLDHRESERTINRMTDSGMLIVTAESDERHYSDREPGMMVDWTEEDIKNAAK